MTFKNKKTLVYGVERSGKAAAKLLNAVGAIVYIYDANDVALSRATEELPFAIPIGNPNFYGLDVIVLSPGVSSVSPELLSARVEGTQVISEIELAYCFSRAKHVAVTGTNGKTTTSMLLHEIWQQSGMPSALLGNVGFPFSASALELSEQDTAILEVSSFQLEAIRYFSPDVAVLLNLAPDHLDRYGEYRDYIRAKMRLFENQSKADYAVLNADDETVCDVTRDIRAKRIMFSARRSGDACVENGYIIWQGKRIIPVSELFSPFIHNLENALAATAVALVSGIHEHAVAEALKSFEPPRFRLEYLGKLGEQHFYNDSKGTNIAATLAAAGGVSGTTALILGGSDKGEDYSSLFAAMPKSVVAAYICGANALAMRDAADGFPVELCSDLRACLAGAMASGAENVLFSPASASFDQYRNFEERGECFDKLFNAARAGALT